MSSARPKVGELLKEKGVDRGRVNLTLEIVRLGEKLQAEAGGKPTLILIDELRGYLAPEDEEQSIYNWLSLERIPSEVFVVLLFNPGAYDGKSLLLPSSCLRLHLATTYRSTKSIINLHSCITSALKWNAPSGNPGTEVVGPLPKLVVLGDLGELEEEEKADRIRFGINLVKSFVAGKEESEVTLIDNSGGLSSLLAKQAEEFSWTMKDEFDMYGGEADRVVVVGNGTLESISRARVSLAVLLCCPGKYSRYWYNKYSAGYRAAIEKELSP